MLFDNNDQSSKFRGNAIYFDGEQYRYCSDNKPTAAHWKQRPCGHCHKPNRADEHDACLGELPGVINACCGHGTTQEAYIQFTDKEIKRGEEAIQHFELLRE